VGVDSHSVFRQKLLGDDGSVRGGVVMVKQPGLFSPKFGAVDGGNWSASYPFRFMSGDSAPERDE
jgi:hypothetical protein